MNTPTNYRNIALSITLGLFTFHLYIVGNLITEKQTLRGLASEDGTTCETVETEALLNESSEGCVYYLLINRDTDTYFINFRLNGEPYHEATGSISDLEGVATGATDIDISDAVLTQVASEIASFEVDAPAVAAGGETDDEGVVAPAAAPVAAEGRVLDTEPEPEAEEIELAVEGDLVTGGAEAVDAEVDEAQAILQRIEELREQVEEVSQCMTDTQSSRAERLLTNAERFSENRIDTDLGNAEARLDDLAALLEDVSEEDCEETDEVATEVEGSPSEQWERYRSQMLPLVRQSLATTGSIDGIEGLRDLALSNPLVDRALEIEVRAYTISAGIHQNTALILQARNTPGADPAQIEALEASNRELLTQLTALSDPSTSGELSPVARNAVAHWSTYHGTLQETAVALAGPAQRVLEQGAGVDETFGTNVNTQTTPAGSYDIDALSEFLRNVRQNIASSRMVLDTTRNRAGENSRARNRLAAPDNRVLDFGGQQGQQGPQTGLQQRSLQSL
jgi:hypothetical protein